MLVEGMNGRAPLSMRQLVPACIVGTAVFIAACMVWAVPHIEHDLEDATRSDLERSGIDTSNVSVDFAFRSGTVAGVLPAGVTADDVRAAVTGDGVRELTIDAAVQP